MSHRWKVIVTAAALTFGSAAFFCAGIGNSPKPYFDESLYVSSARALLAHGADPTPEVPPMGKLLIAGGIRTFGDNPLGWRFASALFGSLTVAGVFLWIIVLVSDFGLALTGALLVALNNFLFVMSRVAMMDIFLVGFLIWALLAFTSTLRLTHFSIRIRRLLLISAGGLFGLACAAKWNGVDSFLVATLLAALLWTSVWSPNHEMFGEGESIREVGAVCCAIALLMMPLAYAATYWALCRNIGRTFDLAELTRMNWYIWHFHRSVQGNPAIAESWYSWPLQFAPQRALSYLVGNWFVMWGGLLALLACATRFWNSFPETLVVALYAANLLQWACTPQKSLYYYYYFPAAMIVSVAIPVALCRLPYRIAGINIRLACVLSTFCIFLFCYAKMAHLGAPFDTALGYWS